LSEKRTIPLADEEVYRRFMGLPVFLCLAIAGAAAYLDVLPKGLIGGMCLLLPLGLVLEGVGARISFMHERRGLKGLAGSLVGESLGREQPQFLVDQGQQFVRSSCVP